MSDREVCRGADSQPEVTLPSPSGSGGPRSRVGAGPCPVDFVSAVVGRGVAAELAGENQWLTGSPGRLLTAVGLGLVFRVRRAAIFVSEHWTVPAFDECQPDRCAGESFLGLVAHAEQAEQLFAADAVGAVVGEPFAGGS